MTNPTITIDNVEHDLTTFPKEVQNIIAALARAEEQFQDQQFELNKTGVFIEAIRAKALELSRAHLDSLTPEPVQESAGLTD